MQTLWRLWCGRCSPSGPFISQLLREGWFLASLHDFNAENIESKPWIWWMLLWSILVFNGFRVSKLEQPHLCSWLCKWLFLHLVFAARIWFLPNSGSTLREWIAGLRLCCDVSDSAAYSNAPWGSFWLLGWSDRPQGAGMEQLRGRAAGCPDTKQMVGLS